MFDTHVDGRLCYTIRQKGRTFSRLAGQIVVTRQATALVPPTRSIDRKSFRRRIGFGAGVIRAIPDVLPESGRSSSLKGPLGEPSAGKPVGTQYLAEPTSHARFGRRRSFSSAR